MNRPDNILAYDEMDLKLGIKSSLPHVKSTLALAILLWECSDHPAELIYSEQNGARAIVRVQSRTGGHVFNAEVRGGKVIYVDAQTNQRYDPQRVLAHVEPSKVSVVRTDNLRISYRAKEMVTPNIGVKNKRR